MDPPLFSLNKLLKTLVNSFVDIFGETYIFLNNYLNSLKKIRGVENALNEAPASQLQGCSPSNMDQYTLLQLCAKCVAFITI